MNSSKLPKSINIMQNQSNATANAELINTCNPINCNAFNSKDSKFNQFFALREVTLDATDWSYLTVHPVDVTSV